MARKRFTAEQIIMKLREAEVGLARGKSVRQVCKLIGVPLNPICQEELCNPGRDVSINPNENSAASLKTDIALDALEQALWSRSDTEGLIHHSDRGVQYLSIRYTERLAEAGIEPSVGSKGDSYDNALAESVIGLFKTEVIRQEGPWRGLEEVEFATLD